MLFPYCEHLRNFEFKYNLFQKYAEFCDASTKTILEAIEKEREEEANGEKLGPNRRLSAVGSQSSAGGGTWSDIKSGNYEDFLREDMMEETRKLDIKGIID